MKLSDAILGAESALDRGLTSDEVVLIGRMVDADRDIADIITMLDKEVPQREQDDDGGTTIRFEVVGDRVRRIE